MAQRMTTVPVRDCKNKTKLYYTIHTNTAIKKNQTAVTPMQSTGTARLNLRMVNTNTLPPQTLKQKIHK